MQSEDQKNYELVVAESFMTSGWGLAVAFEKDPDPPLEWTKHTFEIKTPEGNQFLSTGQVEFARKVPPGEVQIVLFEELGKGDIPIGSLIRSYAIVRGGGGA